MNEPWPEGPRLRSGHGWYSQPSGSRLVGPEGAWDLPGGLWGALVGTLDGRPADAVAEALPDPWDPAEGYWALNRLQALGVLEEGRTAFRSPRGGLRVRGIGVDVAGWEARLGCVPADGEAMLELLLAPSLLDPALDAFASTLEDVAWLPVQADPRDLRAGPIFRPGGGPCWDCLRTRLRMNADGEGPPGRLAEAAPPELLWNVLAMEARRWISGLPTVLEEHLWRHEGGRASLHPVPRPGGCRRCGGPAPAEGLRPPVLTAEGSGALRDAETLARHLSPLTGVASGLRRLSPPEDALAHVYAVRHPFPRTFHSREEAAAAPGRFAWSAAGGRGLSDASARASALAECLERVSGIFRGDEPRRRASLEGLGAEALHPNAVMGFSARQYAARGPWDPTRSLVHFVPRPFEAREEMDWSPLWSLTRQAWRWLPTACCYYGYPQALEEAMALADSNGCASGPDLPGAVLRGLLELVERDAVALWWYNRLPRPRLRLEGDPFAEALQRRLEGEGRSLWVLEAPSELGVPVYIALSRRWGEGNGGLLAGFGAHPDPRGALHRALTEILQVRHQFFEVAANGAERLRGPAPEAEAWWAALSAEPQPFLEPAGAVALPEAWGLPAEPCAAVEALVARLGALGLEVLVLDQSRPELDLAVARVAVPGLCHFWRRLGCPRLREAPARLGWLPAPLPEEGLNPVSIFL